MLNRLYCYTVKTWIRSSLKHIKTNTRENVETVGVIGTGPISRSPVPCVSRLGSTGSIRSIQMRSGRFRSVGGLYSR